MALGSRDQAVRCVAASDLGEFGPAAISAVPALIETLRVSLHSPLEAATSAWPAAVPRDAAEVAARVGAGRAGCAIDGSDLSIEGSASVFTRPRGKRRPWLLGDSARRPPWPYLT